MTELNEATRKEQEEKAARQKAIFEGCRAAFDMLLKHPELPPPDSYIGGYLTARFNRPPRISASVKSVEELQAAVRALPGQAEKFAEDDSFGVRKTFPGGVTYTVKVGRLAVCEKRKVGTETIKRQIPVAYETEYDEVDVFEYECPDSLLGFQVKPEKEADEETVPHV